MGEVAKCPVTGEVIPSVREIEDRLANVVQIEGSLSKRAIICGLAKGLHQAALKRGIGRAEKEFEFVMGYAPPPDWRERKEESDGDKGRDGSASGSTIEQGDRGVLKSVDVSGQPINGIVRDSRYDAATSSIGYSEPRKRARLADVLARDVFEGDSRRVTTKARIELQRDLRSINASVREIGKALEDIQRLLKSILHTPALDEEHNG